MLNKHDNVVKSYSILTAVNESCGQRQPLLDKSNNVYTVLKFNAITVMVANIIILQLSVI